MPCALALPPLEPLREPSPRSPQAFEIHLPTSWLEPVRSPLPELPERLRQHPAVSILLEAARRAVSSAEALLRADHCARLAASHDLAIEELLTTGGGLLRDPDLGADRAAVRAWLVHLRRLVATSVAQRLTARKDQPTGNCCILLRLV